MSKHELTRALGERENDRYHDLAVCDILCELTDAIGWKETPGNLAAFKVAAHKLLELIDEAAAK